MTINKVCGSGLKAVMLAADSIALGRAAAAVAGGQESMTLAPHLLTQSRAGYRMGPIQAQDSMLTDGLWDPYNNWHMGQAAELCVREYKLTREAQDAFAKQSYQRAQAALQQGAFTSEIADVEIVDKKGSVKIRNDEEPGRAQFDKMATLRAAFEKDGTITAANASKINDGAAALVLASSTLARKHQPMARIVAQAHFAQDPKWFTTAPVEAMRRAVQGAGLKTTDIDLWEINEAFAAVTMAAMRDLDLDPSKVNVHGGAIALGHPIGASGARILTTLLHALVRHQKRYGVASLCLGGGEAVAVVVERV
jgi:acetyl-CoA C-acetyltransferase